jgi:predicted cupin superfamily sugar epimerase
MRKADDLIKLLKLKPHPEGGFFRETYRSDEVIKSLPDRYNGPSRNTGTSILFLLKGNQFSAFHKLLSDEIWHFYEGSKLKLFIIDPTGNLLTPVLGSDISKGEQYQFTVPHNCWFSARPLDPKGYSLLGCTVAPGFDFSDFQLADREELLKLYPQHESIIKSFT